MKNTKFIICLILSISLGIAATTPLLMAELTVKPWITRIQGPTAPFNIEVVYANFTLTDLDAPITQTSGPIIDYCFVVNVTNPSEYRTMLFNTYLLAAQEVQSFPGRSSRIAYYEGLVGGGGEAKGAWVDGVYYNLTQFMPWPYLNSDGTISQDPPSQLAKSTDEVTDVRYYQWVEGVQYYTTSVNDGTSINNYTYLNMNGTWVDVTGRITIDEIEPEYKPVYSGTGSIITRNIFYTGSGHVNMASKDNEYNRFFAPGESRLLIISGRTVLKSNWLPMIPIEDMPFASVSSVGEWDWTKSEGFINPVDVIQSGIVQMLTQVETYVDLDPVGEPNTYTDMRAKASEVQELILTRVGNSYIYNTVLSDNQMFQLDQYGLEVFIVPME
jgi:hypothetical protein